MSTNLPINHSFYRTHWIFAAAEKDQSFRKLWATKVLGPSGKKACVGFLGEKDNVATFMNTNRLVSPNDRHRLFSEVLSVFTGRRNWSSQRSESLRAVIFTVPFSNSSQLLLAHCLLKNTVVFPCWRRTPDHLQLRFLCSRGSSLRMLDVSSRVLTAP